MTTNQLVVQPTHPTRVGIVYSDEYREACCLSPKLGDRFALVSDLIAAYSLNSRLTRIAPFAAADDDGTRWSQELARFHSADHIEAVEYLDSLYQSDEEASLEKADEAYLDEYGLTYDCPGFPGVLRYALAPVRGSLAAAEALLQNKCQVAINWAGGWHHAKRSESAGFCYFNDVVLACQRLLASTHSTVGSVLYLDLDLHHGDGVEEAFAYSPRLVTASIHHASPGFFPGTGAFGETDITTGYGRGLYSAFNLPLAEQISDESWSRSLLPLIDCLNLLCHFDYFVVQCGADALATDPHKIFNLTNNSPVIVRSDDSTTTVGGDDEDESSSTSGYELVLRRLLAFNKPTLLLGGGGYNFADTARLWTLLTGVAIECVGKTEVKLSNDIPEHAYFDRYGPDFSLLIDPGMSSWKEASTSNVQSVAHHTRLLEQACQFADLNKLEYNRDELERCFTNSTIDVD